MFSGQNILLLTRNLIFMSIIRKSGVQREHIEEKCLRTCMLQLLLFHYVLSFFIVTVISSLLIYWRHQSGFGQELCPKLNSSLLLTPPPKKKRKKLMRTLDPGFSRFLLICLCFFSLVPRFPSPKLKKFRPCAKF